VIQARFLRLSLALILFVPLSAATRDPVRAKRAMVVSSEENATRAGVEILRDGGNAVDAAIAVGFALAVTHPWAGNLGGGGFMLIRFADGRTTFLDFRERAPRAASRDMYLDAQGKPTDDSVAGSRASGAPGPVRGFDLALKKDGTKQWAALIEPAITLAQKGFPLTWGLAESLRSSERMARFPESHRIFQRDGRFYEMGEVLRQPELAATFERIAKSGPNEFYEGKTAQLIAADMERNGGTITLEDLKEYTPVERQPLRSTYKDYELLLAPPPSSGGIGIGQMLNMLEGSDYEKAGAGSASAIHYVAEVMRRYFADRALHFGDPDFSSVPGAGLLSKKYALSRRSSIRADHVTPSASLQAGEPAGYESSETTHYSVVDSQGNAVAVTYTLNGAYGSGVTAKGTGVLLNNEMDDFTVKPGEANMYGVLQGEKNAIEPRKRPLSSMTPTILTRGGKLFMIVGSPGGPTIISTVLEVILNVVDFKMDLQQAVDFPRFHHQWMPDELRVERYGTSPDTIESLRQRGHEIRFVDAQGRVTAIQATEDGWLLGAADSRSEGLALGF
jgi:gamma-glutamyltranspeptidase/glutathione hydrolase